jgi:carboxypeptidase D
MYTTTSNNSQSIVVVFFPFMTNCDAHLMDLAFRTHLCGFDLNLTYPQNGVIPNPPLIFPTQRNLGPIPDTTSRRTSFHEFTRRADIQSRSATRERDIARRAWKEDALRANGTIDPWVSFHPAIQNRLIV